jgi:hypothetical protein
MPASYSPIPVPRFSKLRIIEAELCAIDLWNGIDFETGIKRKYTDEDFIVLFSRLALPLIQIQSTSFQFQNSIIHDFIVLSKMKALYRSTKPLDVQQAVASFATTAGAIYLGFRNGTLKLENSYDYGTQAAQHWGLEFVQKQIGQVASNGFRVPLANRILFYALPDLQVFNFSNPLAKSMHLQSRPQAALPHFSRLMSEGLARNAANLSLLNPPKSKAIYKKLWTKAIRTDWWQRRVLDIAMLIHHKLAVSGPGNRHRARVILQGGI